jgi:hypothetical protein
MSAPLVCSTGRICDYWIPVDLTKYYYANGGVLALIRTPTPIREGASRADAWRGAISPVRAVTTAPPAGGGAETSG